MNLTKLDNKPLPDDLQIDRLTESELLSVSMLCKLTLEQDARIKERLAEYKAQR